MSTQKSNKDKEAPSPIKFDRWGGMYVDKEIVIAQIIEELKKAKAEKSSCSSNGSGNLTRPQ